MKSETKAERTWRYLEACFRLKPLGWKPVGIFRFEKDGKVYDLSAADLNQIERIEAEGLFVLSEQST